MSDSKYDVVYGKGIPQIEPHFCRYFEDGVGCFGTNPNHGYTFDEAKHEVVEWLYSQAKNLKEITEEQMFPQL